jgi:hypothetical protein
VFLTRTLEQGVSDERSSMADYIRNRREHKGSAEYKEIIRYLYRTLS